MLDKPHDYRTLPSPFYAPAQPFVMPAPALIAHNEALADWLNLTPEQRELPYLSGQEARDGIALAYAGHQFGNWVPLLGDGRAILIGQARAQDGRTYDLQLKGAGRTHFSRNGDGRSALGPVLREYLLSEAMAVLGVPTTRALAALTTGERVQRQTASPGGALVRVAASHLRVGTVQYAAAHLGPEALSELVRYTLARHYPEAEPGEFPAQTLLDGVVARQAELVARWMSLGFIHGVMNTDNTALSGETLDYGPAAFLDAYEPGKVFSSIDRGGRYAFNAQPQAINWNLVKLAEALLPLFGENQEEAVARAQESVDAFSTHFQTSYLNLMRAKLGLARAESEDAALVQSLLDALEAEQADFTLAFRGLANAVEDTPASLAFLGDWLPRWRQRLAGESEPAKRMRAANPLYAPRNHLIARAIAEAETDGDFSLFHRLAQVWRDPFTLQTGQDDLTLPPQPSEEVRRTFCGT